MDFVANPKLILDVRTILLVFKQNITGTTCDIDECQQTGDANKSVRVIHVRTFSVILAITDCLRKEENNSMLCRQCRLGRT